MLVSLVNPHGLGVASSLKTNFLVKFHGIAIGGEYLHVEVFVLFLHLFYQSVADAHALILRMN